MADDLLNADLSLAIVKAQDRYGKLAKCDDAPKRKSRWSLDLVTNKRGRRWGQLDDKPYKPLPYIDLPVGFTDKDVDQFLREQRLEDLQRKMKTSELEDIDADIRPPSPPPTYDREGNRTNRREVRIQKAMSAEYNRLIRYMIKNIEGYTPPQDWKPQKLIKKVIIPVDKFPNVSFMGIIVGARGQNHKRLQAETGCRIEIRGKDVTSNHQNDDEASMPQHVHIEGDTEEAIDHAERLITPLLDPTKPEFEEARLRGIEQLALVNGYTLAKSEQRCYVCGAVGHMGFECPENQTMNYKMANVTCEHCGDKGHVSMDCPKKKAENEEENGNWREKAQMDKEFSSMLNELGMAAPSSSLTTNTTQAITGGSTAGREPDPNAVLLPPVLIGKFIGSKGAHIKGMQEATGCRIELVNNPDPNAPREVQIMSDDPEKVATGRQAVQSWIDRNINKGKGKGTGKGWKGKDSRPFGYEGGVAYNGEAHDQQWGGSTSQNFGQRPGLGSGVIAPGMAFGLDQDQNGVVQTQQTMPEMWGQDAWGKAAQAAYDPKLWGGWCDWTKEAWKDPSQAYWASAWTGMEMSMGMESYAMPAMEQQVATPAEYDPMLDPSVSDADFLKMMQEKGKGKGEQADPCAYNQGSQQYVLQPVVFQPAYQVPTDQVQQQW